MEDMIRRILDVDTRAREITSKAEQTKAVAEQSIPERGAKLKQEYLEKALERVKKAEAADKEAAERAFAEKSAMHQKQLGSLDETFRQNREAWINAIVKSVLEE